MVLHKSRPNSVKTKSVQPSVTAVMMSPKLAITTNTFKMLENARWAALLLFD